MNIRLYVAVGIGGMIGAVGRYGVSILFGAVNGFPYATLTVNLIGCFLLSFILNNHSIKQRLSPEIFAATSIGLVSSFTTFSTFSIETIGLWNSNLLVAISYVFLSLIGGIAFCYAGFKVAKIKRVAS